MWPWKRQVPPHELLERLESLERRFKTLLADVDEYFHLVRRAENRMVKKAAILEAAPSTAEGNGDAESGSPVPSPWTPAQQRIIEQVNRRRAHIPPRED